jgi:hypothetical protein
LYSDSLQYFPVQRKLSIGAVNPLENEADDMADKVMRMPSQNFIQRKCAHCEEEEKAKRKPLASFIQKKQSSTNNSVVANDNISSKIQLTKGSGNSMPEATKSFMENRFSTDFSNVKIHTGNYASQLSNQLSAQAFTVDNNIYFNEGKYSPDSFAGKHLLAHELTHVVQQKNNLISRQPAPQQATVTTPMVKGGTPMQQGGYSLQIGYITVTVLPDVYNSPKEPPHTAHTYLSKPTITISPPNYTTDPKTGLITSFTPYPSLQIGLSVETNYATGVTPSGPSDYGFGTRPQDRKAGTTSIMFHEGSHGSLFISYIQNHISSFPLPVFGGRVGMTENEFLQKDAEYLQKVGKINQMILDAIRVATITVDCAGVSIDQHNAGRRGYVNICP